MPINLNIKKKVIILFYLIISCIQYSSGQQLSGIYRFSYPLNEETQNSYFIFNKDSFICFTLGNSIHMFDGEDELKSYGVGSYKLLNNKFSIQFKTDSLLIPIFLEDSLSVSFNTKKNQEGTNIKVDFYNEISKQQLGGLFIETTKGEIYKNFGKSNTAKAYIPVGSIITSIKIGMVNMPLKNLPVLEHYNNIVYNLFVRDKKSAIKVFISESFEFEIVKIIGDSIYLINKRSGLQKINKSAIEFLNSLASKQDQRLKILLNYFGTKKD